MKALRFLLCICFALTLQSAWAQSEVGEMSERELLLRRLVKRLDTTDPVERERVEIALYETVTKDDLMIILPLLKGGNALAKQIVLIRLLEKLGDERAAPALRFEYEQGFKETHPYIISAFGKLRFDWPIPILASAIASKDLAIGKRAAAGLGFIGSEKARYALTEALARRNVPEPVLDTATWALQVSKREIDPLVINEDFSVGRKVVQYYLGTRYYFYQPSHRPRRDVKPWLLVCIHGENLKAEALFELCVNQGKAQGLAVVAPFFDPMQYPEYEGFNIRGERADKRLLEIVKHVGEGANLHYQELYMYGEDLGGDFVQRFALAYPNRIAKAVYLSKSPILMSSKGVFPESITPSPFAPDLAMAWVPYMKSDVVAFYNPDDRAMGMAQELGEQIDAFSKAKGISNRSQAVRVMTSSRYFEDAMKYFFPKGQ